jgi:hypothetical protein
MRGAACAWAVVSACYAPVPPEGAACNLAGDCPQGLRCIAGECRSASPDPDAPSGNDTPPTGCVAPMLGEFSTPVIDAQLSSMASEGTPTVSADLREIYIKSGRAGGFGGTEIWRATRASAGAVWSDPQLVLELGSPVEDESPELSADGLTLWLTSQRTNGNRDIHVATRATPTSRWSLPERVGELASSGNDEGMFVLPSQLVAYVHSDRHDPGSFDMRIYRTTRAAITGAWSAPELVTELDRGVPAENPWVTADDCTMYFHTGDNSSTGEQAIVYTTRTASGAFGPLQLLPSLDAPGVDADPWLSPDQRTILFASDRSGEGEFDLYVATR